MVIDIALGIVLAVFILFLIVFSIKHIKEIFTIVAGIIALAIIGVFIYTKMSKAMIF